MRSNPAVCTPGVPSQFVRLLLAAVLFGPGAGCATARQYPSPSSPAMTSSSTQAFQTAPLLQPGDMLNIQVWRQPEYSGEFEITADGMVRHPLYRGVKAAGREVGEVEEDLHILLTRYLGEPSFVVEGLVRVAVGGEVRSPNVYPMTTRTSIAEAIAQAGGPTPRGRTDRVILRRAGQNHALDLNSPDVQLRDLEVRSGDEIVVERRVDVFREYVAPSAAIVAAIAAVLRLII